MKRHNLIILSATLVIAIVSATLIPVYAASGINVVPTEVITENAYSGNVDEISLPLVLDKSCEDATVELTEALPATIDENFHTYELSPSVLRGTSNPTEQWNFSDGWYQGHVSGMSTLSLYTNYTFQPNSKGELTLQAVFSRSCSSSCTVLVECFDASTNKMISSTEYPTNFNDNVATAMKFPGLSKNSTYYFRLSAVYSSSNSVTGSFHVRQS